LINLILTELRKELPQEIYFIRLIILNIKSRKELPLAADAFMMDVRAGSAKLPFPCFASLHSHSHISWHQSRKTHPSPLTFRHLS
jgi:hypothetical protein